MPNLNDACKQGLTQEVTAILANSAVKAAFARDNSIFFSPLLNAAYAGHGLIVRQLTDAGARVDMVNGAGQNIIQIMHAMNGRESGKHTTIIANYLLPAWIQCLKENSTDLNVVDSTNRRPLAYAIMYNNKNMASELLQNGADGTLSNGEGKTYLQISASGGESYKDLSLMLLQNWFEKLKKRKQTSMQGIPKVVPLYIGRCDLSIKK